MKLIDKAIKIKKELDLFNKENEDVCTVSGNNIAQIGRASCRERV